MALRANRERGKRHTLPPSLDWLVSFSALAVISASRYKNYTKGWSHLMVSTPWATASSVLSTQGDWCLVASLAGHAFILTGDLDISDTPSILLVQDYFILISAFTFLVNKYHLLFINYVLHKHVYNF